LDGLQIHNRFHYDRKKIDDGRGLIYH